MEKAMLSITSGALEYEECWLAKTVVNPITIVAIAMRTEDSWFYYNDKVTHLGVTIQEHGGAK